MIEYGVLEKASTRDDICGKVVGTSNRAHGARGSVGGANSGDESLDPEDVITMKHGLTSHGNSLEGAVAIMATHIGQ